MLQIQDNNYKKILLDMPFFSLVPKYRVKRIIGFSARAEVSFLDAAPNLNSAVAWTL